jgi:Uma2 family endonuclease
MTVVSAMVVIEDRVEIPLMLQALSQFREWAASDQFPESGRIDYLAGRIEVDMSPEDLYSHGKVKIEVVGTLWQRIKREDLGDLYTDSTRVSSREADLSCEPDVVFVSRHSLESGRVRMVAKANREPDRFVELEGAPDLVVEIVSDTSMRKDTERLPLAYFRAGVLEYWLIDARAPELMFRIFTRGPGEFVPVVPDTAGFQLSAVLGCRYRLVRRREASRVKFDLEGMSASIP